MNHFLVQNHSYDDSTDTLSVRVVLTLDCLGISHEPDQSTEQFVITADFSNRRYTIVDSGDFQGDVEQHYPATVLVAFMRAFTERYAELDHTSSPSDAFDTPMTFTVNIQ
jgi:hypothetical protein